MASILLLRMQCITSSFGFINTIYRNIKAYGSPYLVHISRSTGGKEYALQFSIVIHFFIILSHPSLALPRPDKKINL